MSAIQLAPVAITPTHPNPGAGFKLKELIQAKDERIAERASPAMFKRVDLRTFDLTTLGTKFDVVLIDPPWDKG